jgi:hypothetical protein
VRWQRGICETVVTSYITRRTNATRSALCALLHLPAQKNRLNIVVHATGCFLVRNVFRIMFLKVKVKLVCQWRQVCQNCLYLVTADNKHECFKKFCTFCNKLQPSGHSCYMAPLKPSKLSNGYIYVFSKRSVHRILKSAMDPLNTFQT